MKLGLLSTIFAGGDEGDPFMADLRGVAAAVVLVAGGVDCLVCSCSGSRGRNPFWNAGCL